MGDHLFFRREQEDLRRRRPNVQVLDVSSDFDREPLAADVGFELCGPWFDVTDVVVSVEVSGGTKWNVRCADPAVYAQNTLLAADHLSAKVRQLGPSPGVSLEFRPVQE